MQQCPEIAMGSSSLHPEPAPEDTARATCGYRTTAPACAICRDPRRDGRRIWVVEESRDVDALERRGDYTGRYHVPGGARQSLYGSGPARLRSDAPLGRIARDLADDGEILLATRDDIAGNATALYVWKYLRDVAVRVTRPDTSDLDPR
jgi:recombination protein RecR